MRVANVSRESESRVESQNMGRECGLRMCVANVSREMGVMQWGREWESRNGVAK